VPVMSCGWLPICWGEPNEPTLRENKGGGVGATWKWRSAAASRAPAEADPSTASAAAGPLARAARRTTLTAKNCLWHRMPVHMGWLKF